MTRPLLLALTLSLNLPALAAAGTLSVEIADLRSDEGQLMVAVVAGADGFADAAPATASLILPAREGSVRFSTDALAPGHYAVRVMHDLNGNAKLDANFVGMPTEPWGFSNDAAGTFGPPRWEDARFELPAEGTTIVVNLNH